MDSLEVNCKTRVVVYDAELPTGLVNLACHVYLLQWATLRIERGAKEKNHPLYKPYVNGKILPCMGTYEVQNSSWEMG